MQQEKNDFLEKLVEAFERDLIKIEIEEKFYHDITTKYLKIEIQGKLVYKKSL